MRKTVPKISGGIRLFFEYIGGAIEGYDLWDRFSHENALHKIGKALSKLEPYALGSGDEEIKKIVMTMKKNREFLYAMVNDKERQNELKVFDLLSNARRRAREGRYDDAVARLYRAIEACAQFTLKVRYEIDTSDVRIENLPVSLQEDYLKKFRDEGSGKIKIPLNASYELPKEKGVDMGLRFFQQYENTLRALLDMRNHSILAHGFMPVKEDIFLRMYEAILSFAGIEENDLPTFPEFEF